VKEPSDRITEHAVSQILNDSNTYLLHDSTTHLLSRIDDLQYGIGMGKTVLAEYILHIIHRYEESVR
jgi:hypothetical protein